MTTVASDLNWCQGFLKDAVTLGTDGTIWSREELLGYYNDGYRDYVSQSESVRRWTALDVPPQSTYAGTTKWEQRFAQGGTYLPCTHDPEARFATTSLFEVDVTEGLPQMASSEGITQGWERAFISRRG